MEPEFNFEPEFKLSQNLKREPEFEFKFKRQEAPIGKRHLSLYKDIVSNVGRLENSRGILCICNCGCKSLVFGKCSAHLKSVTLEVCNLLILLHKLDWFLVKKKKSLIYVCLVRSCQEGWLVFGGVTTTMVNGYAYGCFKKTPIIENN